ncbi:tigger transposable element-derived protein [Elysia marginata]|uniref:Tigger transposable element-derived protein n=1 Tax=Elysia marginata TaxID=1093978 RepID=A0AAV4IP86_9GAST|nr:tigger transposable element-derived protein [Elysia marginata]
METSEPLEAVDYSQALSKNSQNDHLYNPTKQISQTSHDDGAAVGKDNEQAENSHFEKIKKQLQEIKHEIPKTKSPSSSYTNLNRSEGPLQVSDGEDFPISHTHPDRHSPDTLKQPEDGTHAECHTTADDSSLDLHGDPSKSRQHDNQPLLSLSMGDDKNQSNSDSAVGQSHHATAAERETQRNSSPSPKDDSQSNKMPTSQKSDVLHSTVSREEPIPESKTEEACQNSSHRKGQFASEHNSGEPNTKVEPTAVVKLEAEISSNEAAKEDGSEERGNQCNPHPQDAEKKKETVLRLLNIPAENSASITDEELKILTKYVFMSPGVSEKMSTIAAAAVEPDPSSTGGRRRHTTRNAIATRQTDTTGRNRPARLTSKRALRRPARQVSDSEKEQEEESGGEYTEKYVRLTLEEKLRVLKLKKDGLTNAKIAKKLGLTNSRVWRILQKKKELLAEAKQGKRKKRYRRTKKEMEASRRNTARSHQENDVHSDFEEGLKEELKEEGDEENSMDESGGKTKGFKTRKDLTLEDRKKVIETLEASKTKVKDLARRFGVSTSSISRIKKNKEVMKLKLATGDLCGSLRRWRDCKDPELDKVLTKWYRAFEEKHSTEENSGTVSVTNTLLKEKAHDLALIMGSHYFASDNWIHRWKNRHNIKSRLNLISDRETFQHMDASIDISLILDALGKQQFKMDEAKREALRQRKTKPEEFLICEHCGVLISSRRKRQDHQPGCPGALSRKDLTLHEKANVVKQLEEPGVTMVSLAKKYGVSTSAISRIHKSRVEILARVAEGGKSLAKRKRDRPSKEPEVERLLCDWYREQRDMGIHATGSAIRDKARDIARILGKDFWPSESWVFRWRHRHNMTGNPSELYDDEEEEEEEEAVQEVRVLDPATGELCSAQASGSATSNPSLTDPSINAGEAPVQPVKVKRPRLPKLIMCEKCGCVSSRKKNSRPVRIRHAKGCPDIRQRNEMTYEDRAKMVHALEEPGATLSSVARQFGVSVSSMSRIRQRKNEILSFTGSKGESKRIRSCKEPQIAEMLYQYYTEKKAVGIHINGPKLKERASMLAREMGREFKVSSGWLGRWRHRYNVFSTPKAPSERIRERDPAQTNKLRKKQQRRNKIPVEGEGHVMKLDAAAATMISSEYDGEGASVGGQIVIDEAIDPVPTSIPATAAGLQPMFLHRSFQTPWDLVTQQQQQQQQQQQPQTVGSWVKDLMPTAVASSMSDHDSVTYTYGEAPGAVLPKPLFHHPHPHASHPNMFEPFPSTAMGYHMALAPSLDASGNLMTRDFLKDDTDDAVVSAVKNTNNVAALSSSHQALSLPHPGHLPHPLLSHSQAQHASLPHPAQLPTSSSSSSHHHHHHHHHHQLGQPQSRQHLTSHHHHHHQQQQQQQQAVQLHGNHAAAASSSSTPTPEEDPEQQRHLMDALKIMSSFAASKSLGDHVQSALRTIEMTMKSNPRKSSSARSSYPSME